MKPLALAALGLGLLLSACSKGGSDAVNADDIVMGSATAPITMIEYASVSCPHCADFNQATFPTLKEKYIDTGKVKYIYREMMFGEPSLAANGHLLARCAGKDKYYSVIDAIMRSQREIFTTGDAKTALQNIALSAGMSQDQFMTCLSNKDGLTQMKDKNDKYMKEDGIEGTPTFFINGKKMDAKFDFTKPESFDKEFEVATKTPAKN